MQIRPSDATSDFLTPQIKPTQLDLGHIGGTARTENNPSHYICLSSIQNLNPTTFLQHPGLQA
jgi:hypothetical protein